MPKRYSGEELLAAHFPEPTWIVPNLLPAGLALLGGKRKIGKSWMALQLARSVCSGEPFMDLEVHQGPVSYFALEDNPRRIQDRMHTQDWPTKPSITMYFGNCDFPHDILLSIQADQPRLLVVDTFASAIGGGTDLNDPGKMTALLQPLQQYAHVSSCCILFVDHLRKGQEEEGADWADDIMSSSAKVAVADVVLRLDRPNGRKGLLRVRGRDLPEDVNKDLQFNHKGMWQVPITPTNLKILEAMKKMGGMATVSQLSEELGMDRGNVSHNLGVLLQMGSVFQDGYVGQVKPYYLAGMQVQAKS